MSEILEKARPRDPTSLQDKKQSEFPQAVFLTLVKPELLVRNAHPGDPRERVQRMRMRKDKCELEKTGQECQRHDFPFPKHTFCFLLLLLQSCF